MFGCVPVSVPERARGPVQVSFSAVLHLGLLETGSHFDLEAYQASKLMCVSMPNSYVCICVY